MAIAAVLLKVAWSAQQEDAKQTNGSCEGIHKEVVAVSQLFHHPSTESHRNNHGSRDKGNLQHSDGVTVASARYGTNGKPTGTKTQAKQQLGREGAAA